MNELNMSSALRHSASVGSKPTSVKSPGSDDVALPPGIVQASAGGKELPPIADSIATKKGSRATEVASSKLEKVDVEQTKKAVENLNEVAVTLQRDLDFKVDDDTGKSIITVTDSVTKEVIRQIPSVEIVELAKKLQSLVQEVPAAAGDVKVGSHSGSLLNTTA